MKFKKSVSFDEHIIAQLKNPKFAVEYLNECLSDQSPEAAVMFFNALRQLATAHGIQKVAKSGEITRDALFKTLTKTRNPKLSTFKGILDGVGLELRLKSKSG